MALKEHQFAILHTLLKQEENLSQRQLAQDTGLSLGTINSVYRECRNAGLIDEEGFITQAGRNALEPYKVDNAVIMAAGLSSRFAPISYEKPKGVLRVRGEVLIERQICQLQEAGIKDITVVVGYKKEFFFYLARKFGVTIVVNPEYLTRNNNSSLWQVRHRLGNTYICSSDDYFSINPFEAYVYKAYYAATYAEGPTEEWCISTGAHRRIVDVQVAGSDSWIMLGQVYFDRQFSSDFVKILEEEYNLPETSDKLWESIYIDHIRDLDMVMRPYPDGVIHEFDSLDELTAFDPHFMENVDTDIFRNIASVLQVEVNEITDFYPLKQGLTNLSCHFSTPLGEYVYRYPGPGTDKLVNRKAEKAALEVAGDLGLDSTFIYEDEKRGWKISRFIANATNLDPEDDSQLKQAMEMCARLHGCTVQVDRQFDFVDEGLRYESFLREDIPASIPGYGELRDKILELKRFADADGFAKVFSHNDFFNLNFLLDPSGHMDLIDWEYAGMSDVASDFGTFVVCCKLPVDRADLALEYYFGRKPTAEERRHFWAYVVFAGWCWYVWSLEKEAEGENVDSYLYIYYSYAADYVDAILESYRRA